MRPELEALLVLQDRDQKIKALHHQQKSLPSERKGLEARLAAARALLDQARQRGKENEVERRKLELEVEGKRASITRFKTQQQQTRKNDEYQGLSKEIERFEADIQALEDRELQLMEESEGLQKTAASAEKDFVKARSVIEDQLAKLEAGAQAAGGRLAELEADHAKLGSAVPEETLDLYRRLFVKKGDAAVVPLEHDICGGCHMKVPVQVSSQVRGDHLLTQCPNCGRILYREF